MTTSTPPAVSDQPTATLDPRITPLFRITPHASHMLYIADLPDGSRRECGDEEEARAAVRGGCGRGQGCPAKAGEDDPMSMTELDVLDTIAWATKHFGSLTTNRQIRRRDVIKAVDRGQAESIGEVELCDGDGFRVQPSRIAEGFMLTDAGKARLAELKEEYIAQTLEELAQ